jgi:Protein of unknown function (DUF3684)
MIKSGAWTTFDIVGYMVSIQPILTPQEFEHLRETSAFPKEGRGKGQLAAGTRWNVQRYKAEDLYEPIDVFRELGLPTIDWGVDVQWESTLASDNGKLLLWVAVEDPNDLPIAQPGSSFH